MFPSGELITVIQTSWTEIQAPPSCSIPKIPSQTSRNFILPRTKKKKGKKKKIREIKTNNYQFIFFFPLLPLRARELERERGERERAALRFFTEARELGERERELRIRVSGEFRFGSRRKRRPVGFWDWNQEFSGDLIAYLGFRSLVST